MAMTLLPYGLKGHIYRCPMPFSRFDPDGDLLREYKECEIAVIAMLVGDEEALRQSGRPLRDIYNREGLQVIQLEIRDFGAPDLNALRTAVAKVKDLAEEGSNTVIHCHAGIGRTGLFAACLERQIHGVSGEEAIAWVRRYLPGAVESDVQVNLVTKFL